MHTRLEHLGTLLIIIESISNFCFVKNKINLSETKCETFAFNNKYFQVINQLRGEIFLKFWTSLQYHLCNCRKYSRLQKYSYPKHSSRERVKYTDLSQILHSKNQLVQHCRICPNRRGNLEKFPRGEWKKKRERERNDVSNDGNGASESGRAPDQGRERGGRLLTPVAVSAIKTENPQIGDRR